MSAIHNDLNRFRIALYTAKSYAALARSMRSVYYLKRAADALEVAIKLNNDNTNTIELKLFLKGVA